MTSQLFAGRWVLVTGGNRGIGWACVQLLAQQGANIFSASRTSRSAWLDELKALSDHHGVQVEHVKLDLNDRPSITAAMHQVAATGPLFGLINNAAEGLAGTVWKSNMEDIYRVFQSNFFGLVEISKLALAQMELQKIGSIVNVSSAAGLDAFAGQSIYGASKSAGLLLTQSLAKEVARFGIRVNAVVPGMTDTDMLENISPQALAEVEKSIALRRKAKPIEIAEAITFLLSPNSAMLTGQILRVDGAMPYP